MPHCRVQSPGEINVMIVPHCRLYWKLYFTIFYFFLFLMQFELWRAAAFVSSPIHLFIIIIQERCRRIGLPTYNRDTFAKVSVLWYHKAKQVAVSQNNDTICGPQVCFTATQQCVDVPFTCKSTSSQSNITRYSFLLRAAYNGGHVGVSFTWIDIFFREDMRQNNFHSSPRFPWPLTFYLKTDTGQTDGGTECKA